MRFSVQKRNSLAPYFLTAVAALFPCVSMSAQAAGKSDSAAPAKTSSVTPRAARSEFACTVKPSTYKGWKSEELANKWVKLVIVPELGGRLMQVNFGGHDMLYNNPRVTGKPTIPGVRMGNPGGDKIWPLPEGGQDEQHWSGGGGHLDGGAYALKILSSTGGKCAVRLTGPYNAETGQRYIRDISIDSDTPIISFHIVMQNMSGFPQTWSEQTVTEYAVSDPAGSENFDKKWYGVVEMNPNSAYPMNAERHADDCVKPTGPAKTLNEYPKGYHVRSGPDVNDAYEVKDGTLRVHWNDIMQEVWVDTPTGWLAAVDGDSGYTMVERHDIDPNHEYPSKASIIFYSSGAPCPRRGRPLGSREGPFIEAEVNSPMVTLKPGESYAMDTTWYPTRMTEEFKKPTWSGVIGQPLAATRTAEGLLLSGDFGVFYPGTLVAHLYPRTQEDNTMKVTDVTPTEMVHLQTTIEAPPGTSRVSIHLVDAKGVDRGPLGEVLVNPPPAPR
jgi:hypothetical protein